MNFYVVYIFIVHFIKAVNQVRCCCNVPMGSR